ncbi:hypothetical protein [Streptacidiphilus jiangxiensis]|uniref:Uncharacterized protein n=1 Tax=Streptacidiphilus jiangxiensis TaxID=235985 RepID=A0A1H7IVT1_STRJI|nr:hypothetical protein [Streptacidiphilus jiangxiensis]SEK66508.1 hypothetical protein SAMN05414137_10333 [Streptacidiphilus jiangxiensis]
MSLVGQSALFKVTVRPARAAYLIAEGSSDGFRRAVQEATSRWGGQTEPIIPVLEDGTIAPDHRRVIEVAHVDGVVNVDAPTDHAKSFAASFDMQCVTIDQIDRWGVTMFTSHPADMALPTTVDGSNGYVIAAEGAPLWQVAAAGDLRSEAEKGFRDAGMVVRRARFDHEIGESQLWDHTLLGATTVSMAETWASPAPMGASTVIILVSDADDLEGCLAFWNLRALRSVSPRGATPIHLLPVDISHWTSWPRVLSDALQRPDQFSPDVLIDSASVEKEAMHTFAESMGLQLSEEQQARRSMLFGKEVLKRAAPFTYLLGLPVGYVGFERRYGLAAFVDVPVVGEKTALRLTCPVPTKSGYGGLSLVSISDGPIDALPKRGPVAKLVEDSAEWHDGGIQIAARLERDWRLELRIPTLDAAYVAVLRERTASHPLSDKGAIGTGLLDESAMAVLAEPDVFETIRQLTTPRGEDIAKKLQKLFGKGQPLTEEQKAFAEEFGGRSERVFKSADRLGYGSFEAAQTALERLSGIGWAERGFQTACNECKIRSFAPFSQGTARGIARCPVCGSSTDYTREPGRGLVVHYRLDARVDFANDNGVIAHLMVIGALNRRYTHTLLKPGVDLFFADGTQGEADVIGICDGKLVSGEVKMSGWSFTDAQLNKDLDIVERLQSDIYLMAATSPIQEETKERAKARCDELGVELLILERNDLLR